MSRAVVKIKLPYCIRIGVVQHGNIKRFALRAKRINSPYKSGRRRIRPVIVFPPPGCVGLWQPPKPVSASAPAAARTMHATRTMLSAKMPAEVLPRPVRSSSRCSLVHFCIIFQSEISLGRIGKAVENYPKMSCGEMGKFISSPSPAREYALPPSPGERAQIT